MSKKQSRKPTVYVIAGPNGAGKTTFSTEFLPAFVRCREFLNADLIAAGLSPFAPATQNPRAGRLLLTRLAELVDLRADFGFETTLSGRTYLKVLGDMRAAGYRVCLFFLCRVPSWQSHGWKIGSLREGIPSTRRMCDAATARVFETSFTFIEGSSTPGGCTMPRDCLLG